jgi:hypothetical protein
MSDELGPAVTALQQKLDEQLQAVSDTKRTINMLLKMSGQTPMYAEETERSGSVRNDQFYGKGLATSAAEYLAIRKQAVQPEDILRGLEAGGFDFDVLGWGKEHRLRNLAISLAKNTGAVGKFHKLKNGSFGLRSWYDEEFLKKAAADAQPKKTKKPEKKTSAKQKGNSAATVKKAQPEKPASSAKQKSRPEADQTAQKGDAM